MQHSASRPAVKFGCRLLVHGETCVPGNVPYSGAGSSETVVRSFGMLPVPECPTAAITDNTEKQRRLVEGSKVSQVSSKILETLPHAMKYIRKDSI